tara:strand:- start:5659 stop:6627 length:969 start_codon:yes stop_codon:yes gene_type:complete
MLDKKISLLSIVAFFLLVLCSPLIYIVYDLYYLGDLQHYNRVYEVISGSGNLSEQYLRYTIILAGYEVIHFLLIAIASEFIPKQIFFTLINILFLFIGAAAVSKHTSKPFWLILIVFVSNFYIHILLFPAERLKFGFIFLFMALFFNKNFYYKYIFVILSILSHFSMLGIYVALLIEPTLRTSKRLILSGNIPKIIFPFMVLILLGSIFFAVPISIKIFGYYNNYGNIFNAIPLTLLFILSYFHATRERKSLLLILLFFIFLSVIVGGFRINFFGIFFWQLHYLKYENIRSIPFILVFFYCFYKLFDFYNKVILYGDGFAAF